MFFWGGKVNFLTKILKEDCLTFDLGLMNKILQITGRLSGDTLHVNVVFMLSYEGFCCCALSKW